MPMSKEESEKETDKADWSSLKSREGVDFIFALSTFGKSNAAFKVTPPMGSRVLSQRLTIPHRNCVQLAKFLRFSIQHFGIGYLSGMEKDEQAKHLPPGQLAVWVERSREVTDGQVFDFIKENYLAEAKLSVTVLQSESEASEKVEEWCDKHGWRYLEEKAIHGSEDQVVVIMFGFLSMVPEYLSRARNLQVIVSTRGRSRCNTLSSSH